MAAKTIRITDLSKPTRLDRILRDALPRVGRKAINQLIQARQVQVNGQTVWLNSWKVHNGDTITLATVPDELPQTPHQFDTAWVLATDDDLIVVNKPAGLLSQGTAYTQQPDMLSMVRAEYGEVALLHRLDRDTSGVLLLTRTRRINRYLDTAFKAHTIIKQYMALVQVPNQLAESGTIDRRLAPQNRKRNRMRIVATGGKSALTDYQIAATTDTHQRVLLWPRTGRTHQLRVHLAHYGASILGDRIYSDTAAHYPRLFLHAHQITLPQSDHFPERTFTAPLPQGFIS